MMGIKKTLASLVLAGAVALGGLTGKAKANDISMKLTADNACSAFIGNNNSVSEMIGSLENYIGKRYIWSADTWSKENIADNSYVYIVADSDYNGSDGLLVDVNSSSNGGVLSGDLRWDVTATGLGSRGGVPPSLLELTTEIVRANSGANPSGGWVTNTPCPFTNEEGGIGKILYGEPVPVPDIDPNSRWMWYNSGRD